MKLSASVHDVVDFVLRTGDLAGTAGFSTRHRALEGTRGHQRLQKQRPPEYTAEVPITWEFVDPEFTFLLRGRIDGVLLQNGVPLIEEIKTVSRGPVEAVDPLHLGQAKLYAFIFADRNGCDRADVRVTYIDLSNDATTEFDQSFSLDQLRHFFHAILGEYLEWVRDHQRWRKTRDESIAKLPFPFEYRPGQRALAVAVYRAVKSGGRLFAEAPTGIGKTISALFPAIKALGEGHAEKIFYLTAKTVGRAVAEETLSVLRAAGLRFRAVTLTAKEKICFKTAEQCDPRACPFALGYYDRIKPALRDALEREVFTRSEIESVARAHQVCPFELSLDLSNWVDALICDYNYVFHPTVSLKRHFDGEKHSYALLIDEAHNLPDRAREMFSASLPLAQLTSLKAELGSELPAAAKALAKLIVKIRSFPKREELIERDGAFVSQKPPKDLAPTLERFLDAAELWLARNEPAPWREMLLDVYFLVLAFQRTLEACNERYVTIFDPRPDTLRLFCLDPSGMLRAALNGLGSALFFSATLTPVEYFRSVLGGEAADPVINLATPFPPENLALLVQDQISTRFNSRSGSYQAVAESLVSFVSARTGNYLVFFPSYAYLHEVLARFRAIDPSLPIQVQSTGMSEPDRELFLSSFQSGTSATLVGFAVLGGIFGEGIDLVGERLVGAAIVGVGLPQISLERDLIREYSQQNGHNGFDHAYKFPGMNRVLQAVGRVIRSSTDRGVVLLIDDRFRHPEYRSLFPNWWRPQPGRTAEAIRRAAVDFWNGNETPSSTPLPRSASAKLLHTGAHD